MVTAEFTYFMAGRGMCNLHGHMRRSGFRMVELASQMGSPVQGKALFPRTQVSPACRYSAGVGLGA